MKIGIMGGTFNPIHNGHIAMAKAALEQQKLDVVWFMPSGLPAHKINADLVSAQDRLKMVELAIEGNTNYMSSSFEIDRAGYTYTANTLTELKKLYPNDSFYFIIGGDSLLYFDSWRQPDIISQHAIILATGRDDVTLEKLSTKAQELKEKFATELYFFDMQNQPISSSAIRNAIKNNSKEEIVVVKEYVPEKVWDYIISNQLYQE